MEMVNLIEKALNIRSYYHKVISGNIANVETPGYKEKDLDFNSELQRQITSGEKDLKGSSIQVTESGANDGLKSLDGNTVNMENQIVKLTENQLMFHTLVQVAAKRFNLMKFLISEGRR
jgi:flagellar basal-body rod protein FlgB